MIYTALGKSKKKRQKQKEIQEYQKWLDSVGALSTNFSSKKSRSTSKRQVTTPQIPKNRSTEHIPSIDTGLGNTSAKTKQVYTGDVIIGIGTMHKSNAVPILRKQDAIDQANMRR